MTTKIKILISILAVGIILIGAFWIWNSQKDSRIIIGKEVDITGSVEETKGCWIHTQYRIVPSEIKKIENKIGRLLSIDRARAERASFFCDYFFPYGLNSPYYVGDLDGKEVKMRARISLTEACYSKSEIYHSHIGCRIYFEPIKIEVIEAEVLEQVTITTDKTEYEQGGDGEDNC